MSILSLHSLATIRGSRWDLLGFIRSMLTSLVSPASGVVYAFAVVQTDAGPVKDCLVYYSRLPNGTISYRVLTREEEREYMQREAW